MGNFGHAESVGLDGVKKIPDTGRVLLAVVSVVVPIFADIDMALRWGAVRIIGGHVEGGPISTEIHARNIDVNRLVTETDLESALLRLPRAGIGHICGIVEVFESSVRLLCELAVQLRKVQRKRRPSGMVKFSRLTISFVNYPFVLRGVPGALLLPNQFPRPLAQFSPHQVFSVNR